jgi:hypothetical protein
MSRTKLILVGLVLLAMALPVRAVSDAALFRLFLLNGETVTSYGEFARIDDRVIFSMPVGGSADEPRLQVVTLPAGMIDWARTERHVDSSRFQRYAAARGDEDFRRLTNDVARVLNQIALTTDRREALAIAEQARRTLADWPRAHFGYRQDEVRDVIGVLDNAISALRGTSGVPAFELSLVATREPIAVEPLAQMPSPREQIDQIFRVVSMTSQATERVALLQSAIALLNEAGAALPGVDVAALRRSAETRIRQELTIDARYARLVKDVSAAARRFAANGRIADTERLLGEIQKRDARLGRQRPEVVLALQASVQVHADSARRLRLLRDRWKLRQSLYSEYQRSVGSQLTQLARSRPQLEAIRSLEGPELAPLQTLRTRLSGGAERLTRLTVPEDLKPAHNLLVSAWRFAENAARVRYEAVASGNLGTAREASSAAAGALMMLSRAQEEIRSFLEPPRLP